MKMTCPKCGAEYNISDAQIPPGGLQIKCRKCLSSFMAQSGGRAVALSMGSVQGMPQTPLPTSVPPEYLNASEPLLAADVPDDASALENPQLPAGTYYLTLAAGHVVGPLDLSAIQQMLREGRLNGSERVSSDRVHWLPAKSFPDLAAMFQKAEEQTRLAAQSVFTPKAPDNGRLSHLASFELGDSLPNLSLHSIDAPPPNDNFDFDFGDLPVPKAASEQPKAPLPAKPFAPPLHSPIQAQQPPRIPPQNAQPKPSKNEQAASFFDDLDDLPAPAAAPPVPVFDDLPAPLDFDLPGLPNEPDLLADPALNAGRPMTAQESLEPIELDLPGPAVPRDLPGPAMPRDLPGQALPRDLPGPAAPNLPGRAMPRDLPGRAMPPNLPGQPMAPNLPGHAIPQNLPGQPLAPNLPEPLDLENALRQGPEMPPVAPEKIELALDLNQTPALDAEKPSDSGSSARYRGRFSQTDLPEFAPGNSAEEVRSAAMLMAQSREQKRKLLFAVIGVVVIVLGLGAFLIVQLNNNEGNPQSTSTHLAANTEHQQPQPAENTQKGDPSHQEPASTEASDGRKNDDASVASGDAAQADEGQTEDGGQPDTLPTAKETLAEIAGYRERISRLELKQSLSEAENIELITLYAFGALEYSGNKAWAQKAQEMALKLKDEPAEGAELAKLAAALTQGESMDAALAYGAAHESDAQAQYLAGHAHLISHDYEQAFKAFARAVSLDENLLPAARMEGDLALRLGHLEDARKIVETLYTKASGAPAVVTALAQIEVAQGNQERALKLLSQVLGLESRRLSPQERSKALLTRARISFDAQRDEEGMADLEGAIKAWPQNMEAINLLSERHFANKQYAKALEQFEALRCANFDGPEITMQIAQCHLALGRADRAIDILEKGVRDFGQSASPAQQAELKSALGEVYLERHELKKAMGVFDDALSVDAHCERALLGHAMVLVREANSTAAIAYLEKAIADYPEGALLHQGLGDLYRKISDTTADRELRQKAVKEFRKALAIEPSLLETRKSLGLVLLDLGENAKALAEFEKLSQRVDFYENLDFEMGKALYRLGRLEEALTHFKAALPIHPDLSELQLLLGATLFDLGQGEEASPFLQKAEQLDSSHKETHYYLGRIALNAGMNDQALQRLRLAHDADKGNYVYRYWLGRALEANGGPEAMKSARQEYDVVANACHQDFALTEHVCDVLFRRGSMRMNQRKEWAGARKDFTLAAKCDTTNPQIYLKLGELSEFEADLPTAIQHYSSAIKVAPDLGEAYAARGNAYSMLEKIREARSDLLQAIKLSPELPEPYYQLCAALREKSLSEAKKYCRKYLELAPKGRNAEDAQDILR